MSEERIVYGANCVWWDSIGKAGHTPPDPQTGTRLPCCPHCGGMLLETPAEQWFGDIRAYDRTEPGYEKMMEWSRGKCFKTFEDLKRGYEGREQDE